MSKLTPEDLEAARPVATKLLELLVLERPTVAVAAAAKALAAIAHLAECGSNPARVLFDQYYESIGEVLTARPEKKV